MGIRKAPPGFFRHRFGDAHTIFQRDAGDGHEGYDISGSQSRVRTLMVVQVDQFRRLGDAAQRRFAHALSRADKCDHRTVVVGIHLAVEQVNVRPGQNGAHNRLHHGGIAAFTEIGNAFDEGLHGVTVAQEYAAG